MRARAGRPLALLLAAAVIVAAGLCLVHVDEEGGPDACASLLAAVLGGPLALGLHGAPSLVPSRMGGYRAWALQPPAPPPEA
jgi:hypothetical protein